MQVSAWDSPVIKCKLCATPGCKYRAVADSEYCCQGCAGRIVTPGGSVPTAKGVIPEQDRFHAERNHPNAVSNHTTHHACRQHDAGCALLEADTLQASFWLEFPCDNASAVFGQTPHNAAGLVIPPSAAEGAAPVVLFLGGDGHIDNKQDFFWGGVDLLVRNSQLHKNCYLVALKPSSSCGLLRCNKSWKRTWDEDAVWSFFTKILGVLGPSEVDVSRIYATGLSLGAIGVWNLATKYGHHLAAIAPVAGACEWPNNCWIYGSSPDEYVVARLKALPIRAYQIDVDPNSGSQQDDMQFLRFNTEASERDLVLPGMEEGKTCDVHVQEWRGDGAAPWELWNARGPLRDWSAWDGWDGDRHFIWQRAYPIIEWGLADFFLRHALPTSRCFKFDSPAISVDLRDKIRDCMTAAAQHSTALLAKPWKEQVREFVDKFFDGFCIACGDRPCLDSVDFFPCVLQGVNAHLPHLTPQGSSVELAEFVRETTHLSYDRVRYSLRSFAIVRNNVFGKQSQVQVREAVDRAREEIVTDMLRMTADEFIKMWITTVHKKLEKDNILYMLPRLYALNLFKDMVTEGAGIPAPLVPQMQAVVAKDWAPLTRTVNLLFDDPEPPKQKWKEEDWETWNKSWNETGNGNLQNSDPAWNGQNALQQMLLTLASQGAWGNVGPAASAGTRSRPY